MKKLTSLILALAMCFALGAPAFATTSQEGNLTTELSSMLPELKLTLPEAATIILNPYRNTVSDSVATASTGIDKGDKLQIMNPVFSVVSTTTNKVHVSADVVASVAGNAAFASAAVNPGSAGHDVYLTLTYGYQSAASATAAVDVPVPDNVTLKNATNVKVINDTEQTLDWDLPAAASSGAGSVQRLNMQFGGSCSDSPTADEGPWTDSDTVSCSFVFTATAVTDDPMVSMMYQATNTTPTYVNLVIDTNQPDFKDTPKIEKIETGNAGATLTDITSSDNNLNDSANGGSSWDGKKITLVSGVIGSHLGVTASGNTPKIVKVSLSYKDKSGNVQKVAYTAKVNVLAAPAAPQQQNPNP